MLKINLSPLTSSLSDLSFLRPPEQGTSGITTAVGVKESGMTWGTMNPHGDIMFCGGDTELYMGIWWVGYLVLDQDT